MPEDTEPLKQGFCVILGRIQDRNKALHVRKCKGSSPHGVLTEKCWQGTREMMECLCGNIKNTLYVGFD